jgi:hypothetical protein
MGHPIAKKSMAQPEPAGINYLVFSLKRLPPRPSPLEALADVSATVYGLEPVRGAAFAWFLLGERWDKSCMDRSCSCAM